MSHPAQTGAARPRVAALARRGLQRALVPLPAVAARMRGVLGRPTRFAGAWPTRAAALASLPATARAGYDAPEVAQVNHAEMCDLAPWDYPVVFWLERLMRDGLRLLDAGGHMGTKYVAFSRLLPLDRLCWTVSDLPAILAAGRRAQAAGTVPAALCWAEDPAQAGAVDVVLASGLLQYLDVPLADYVGRLSAPPRHILLNKVALRDGADVVTLERIGPARVPYRIRNRARLEAEFVAMGYAIRDSWGIDGLGHVIPTHPWLGRSESRGYLLERG